MPPFGYNVGFREYGMEVWNPFRVGSVNWREYFRGQLDAARYFSSFSEHGNAD